MYIDNDIISEVVERTDITDYISRYVPLKRAGSVMSGSCPFHSERTPSFTVFPNTKSYYCFGCGAGGNVISFAMAINGLEYVEAIRTLAKECGVDIPEEKSEISTGIRKSVLFEANKEAARFFHSSLISQGGKSAMEYLTGRGLSNTTIRRFGIGYAPDSWTSLTDTLFSKGYSESELDAAFLSKRGKNGKMYDIFRNRIVFPLISTTGEVLGFSARRLNEADERKYVNTSDTPIFKKSKFVFALNMAKAHSANELIMCEGCIDAIALHQAGFDGAVATLGTAITPEQSRTLSKHTKKIYLCYDSDAAGQTAAEKGIKLLNELGVSTKVVKVKNAKDPDEYIKKFGADSFRQLLTSADGEVDFLIGKAINGIDISNPENKLKAISTVTALLAELDSLAKCEVYTKRAAEMLEISKKALEDEVARQRKKIQRKSKKDFEKKELLKSMGTGDKANLDKLNLPAEAMLEEKLMGILLIQPELYTFFSERITEDLFFTDFGRKVFSVYKSNFENGTEIILTNENFTSDEISALAKLIAIRHSNEDNTKEGLLHIIEALERKKQKAKTDDDILSSDGDSRGEMLKNYINSLKNKKN